MRFFIIFDRLVTLWFGAPPAASDGAVLSGQAPPADLQAALADYTQADGSERVRAWKTELKKARAKEEPKNSTGYIGVKAKKHKLASGEVVTTYAYAIRHEGGRVEEAGFDTAEAAAAAYDAMARGLGRDITNTYAAGFAPAPAARTLAPIT